MQPVFSFFYNFFSKFLFFDENSYKNPVKIYPEIDFLFSGVTFLYYNSKWKSIQIYRSKKCLLTVEA